MPLVTAIRSTKASQTIFLLSLHLSLGIIITIIHIPDIT